MKHAKQFCLLLVLCGIFLPRSLSQPPASPISINEVRVIPSPLAGSLFEVTYSVIVPKGKALYIDDIGFIDSNTSLRYLTRSDHIIVRSVPGATPIMDAHLEPNVVSMSGSLTQVPEAEFKYPGGESVSVVPHNFVSLQAEVLAKYFLLPPYIYSANSMTFSESVYHQLPVQSRNLIVEVAVQLAFETDRKDAHFALKYAARERRKGTDWQPELESEAEAAVKDFIAKLERELEGVGAHV